MRILLAYKSHPEGAADPYTSLLPIGLGYINGMLSQAGHDCSVANFSNCDWNSVASYLAAVSPRILGISQFTHNRFESLKLAAVAKAANPSCIVVFGGPHATFRYREILLQAKEVDAVVVGEGEETFRELAERVQQGGDSAAFGPIDGLACRKNGEVVFAGVRAPVSALDALPVPALFLNDTYGSNLRRQLEFITTSRGCPASCRFCSSPDFWHRQVRFRSPRSIVDEIRYIRDRFGLVYFSFRDDTFTADRSRVIELCRLLISEKLYVMWNCQSRVNTIDEEMLIWMKRAGCECIQIGVESGSLRVLQNLGKGVMPQKVETAARAIRRVGIHLSIYLITGVPGEDDDDLAATIRLIDAIQPHDGQVSPLAYYPGTSLYTEAVASGEVQQDIFETTRAAAVVVRSDRSAARHSELLMKALERAGRKSRFRRGDYLQQKEVVGYCYATNVIAGEYYEAQGEYERAEKEYREIVEREPENPWGWLALGELLGETGDYLQAQQAFRTLTRLLPSYAPAYSALGDIARLSGDAQLALRCYEQALDRDAADVVALEGITRLRRKTKK